MRLTLEQLSKDLSLVLALTRLYLIAEYEGIESIGPIV